MTIFLSAQPKSKHLHTFDTNPQNPKDPDRAVQSFRVSAVVRSAAGSSACFRTSCDFPCFGSTEAEEEEDQEEA